MKKALTILMAIVAVLAAYIAWDRWDSGKNRGYTSGYYGEFNTVSNALAHLTGVTIISSWYNRDITLEEFAFDIRTSDRQDIHLGFSETDPIRKLSGSKLQDALAERIKKDSSNHSKLQPPQIGSTYIS